MTYSKVGFDFGDGYHEFELKIGELRELKTKTGVGPMKLYQKLANQEWEVDDCREIIRLGLIGAGTKPLEALDFVRRYVEQRPLFESVQPALTILIAAIFGPPEELQPGKKVAAPEATTMTSNSGASTPTESSSA